MGRMPAGTMFSHILTLAAGLHFVSVGANRVPPAHSTAKWTCKHVRLGSLLTGINITHDAYVHT